MKIVCEYLKVSHFELADFDQSVGDSGVCYIVAYDIIKVCQSYLSLVNSRLIQKRIGAIFRIVTFNDIRLWLISSLFHLRGIDGILLVGWHG